MIGRTGIAYIAAVVAYEWATAITRQVPDRGLLAVIPGTVEAITFGLAVAAGLGLIFAPAAVLSLRLLESAALRGRLSAYLGTVAIWLTWSAIIAVLATRGGPRSDVSLGPVVDTVFLGAAGLLFVRLLPDSPWKPGRLLTLSAALIAATAAGAAAYTLAFPVSAT